MVKVSDLTSNRTTITVQIPMGLNEDGEMMHEPLVVVYRPNAYTANTELDLNEKRDSTWKSALGLSFVNALIESWDLQTDDGEPYPLWIEHPDNLAGDGGRKSVKDGYNSDLPCLAALPSNFIGQVIEGVSEDMGGDEADSSGS